MITANRTYLDGEDHQDDALLVVALLAREDDRLLEGVLRGVLRKGQVLDGNLVGAPGDQVVRAEHALVVDLQRQRVDARGKVAEGYHFVSREGNLVWLP